MWMIFFYNFLFFSLCASDWLDGIGIKSHYFWFFQHWTWGRQSRPICWHNQFFVTVLLYLIVVQCRPRNLNHLNVLWNSIRFRCCFLLLISSLTSLRGTRILTCCSLVWPQIWSLTILRFHQVLPLHVRCHCTCISLGVLVFRGYHNTSWFSRCFLVYAVKCFLKVNEADVQSQWSRCISWNSIRQFARLHFL